jgi:hypothetical protein
MCTGHYLLQTSGEAAPLKLQLTCWKRMFTQEWRNIKFWEVDNELVETMYTRVPYVQWFRGSAPLKRGNGTEVLEFICRHSNQ